MIRDNEARESFKGNKNTVISWMLAASYAYYIMDRPILSDSVFDGMMKWALNNWDSLEHPHKYLITKEDLENGSLFGISLLEYPNIVKNSVEVMLSEQG